LAAAFLYHLLTGDSFKEAIGGHATGSAQLNFGPSHIDKVEIGFPGYDEQTAIATILSDMDTELAELEARLAKARHIKQGMMQELLTGRIRLL
jgi:type I restriction enzyme S subunit